MISNTEGLQLQDNGTLESQTSYTDSSIGEEADATSNTVSGDDIVEFATRATWKALFLQNFDPWKFRPRDWQEPSPVSADALYLSCINLGLLGTDPANIARPLAGEVDESYSLSVTQQGVATISANTSIGLSRSLTTFTQLFYAHSDQQNVYTPLAPVSIFDAPRFAHRGLNLDVSRSYYPVSDIKRQISACAYTKMNRFHLHATDSQAWPLEIPSLPSVSERGAYRPHLVYSKDDFAHLQRYAALQGVEMITEIDMPGHTSSIAYSFPELIAAFNMQPDWTVYANDPPSGTLKLNSPAVRTFIQTLFNGVLPRVQPFSSYFHTGGDEVNVNAYLLDETVKSNDSAVLTPLMQAFIDHAHGLIRAQGLAPIVWEEMLLKWKLNLASDVVVQAWRSSKSVADIVATGHKVIAGNYDFWVSFFFCSFSLLDMHFIKNTDYTLSISCTNINEIVPLLRHRPIHQLRAVRQRALLAFYRLLCALQELACDLLVRSASRRALRPAAPCHRRRSTHVVAASRSHERGPDGVAARRRRRRGAVERRQRRARSQP